VRPEEAAAVGAAAVAGGARVLEVPLNSPRPLESIRALAAAFAARPEVLVGAGTVLTAREAAEVAAAGGELALAPNADAAVIAAARAAGLLAWPGVATPTEALAALAAGASGLKLFPASALAPATVRAWGAVLPRGTPLLAVGGVDARNAREYEAAGCEGAGVGTAIYAPGDAPGIVEQRVRAFLHACR
jgi:2-dehydro-3-deoxyphosphogalactonate aldolase